MAQIVKNK